MIGQVAVTPAPQDAISAVKFSADPKSTKFAVSSWDKNVYLYEYSQESGDVKARLISSFEHRAPVLDVCFGANDEELYTAGLDWDVRKYGTFIVGPCESMANERIPESMSHPRSKLY